MSQMSLNVDATKKVTPLKHQQQTSRSENTCSAASTNICILPTGKTVPLQPIPSAPRQSQSSTRAVGEKISVGYKIEDVIAMVQHRSQLQTLLHNILGGWNADTKQYSKLKYVLALLKEIQACGGAPIKHKNWTVVRMYGC